MKIYARIFVCLDETLADLLGPSLRSPKIFWLCRILKIPTKILEDLVDRDVIKDLCRDLYRILYRIVQDLHCILYSSWDPIGSLEDFHQGAHSIEAVPLEPTPIFLSLLVTIHVMSTSLTLLISYTYVLLWQASPQWSCWTVPIILLCFCQPSLNFLTSICHCLFLSGWFVCAADMPGT